MPGGDSEDELDEGISFGLMMSTAQCAIITVVCMLSMYWHACVRRPQRRAAGVQAQQKSTKREGTQTHLVMREAEVQVELGPNITVVSDGDARSRPTQAQFGYYLRLCRDRERTPDLSLNRMEMSSMVERMARETGRTI